MPNDGFLIENLANNKRVSDCAFKATGRAEYLCFTYIKIRRNYQGKLGKKQVYYDLKTLIL